jgi:hypothetical protein
VLSVFNNGDSFPGSEQLYFQNDQLSSAHKFAMAQFWTSPIAKTWDLPEINSPWNTPIVDTSASLINSGHQSPQNVDMPVSQDLYRDTMKYQHEV